jgi:hypothetical protein
MIKATITIRAKSRFSDDLVERARSMPGSCVTVAQATGISLAHTKAIRNGTARRPLASPWAGLLGPAR